MYEPGSYCVYRNVERRNNPSPQAAINSDKLLVSQSMKQANYYQSCSKYNHHVPFSLLQEYIYEDLVLNNQQQKPYEGRFAVDSRLLSCTHGGSKLLLFAGGEDFRQVVIKPIANCLDTPYNRQSLFCKGFSYDIRGNSYSRSDNGAAGWNENGLTDGPISSISYIGQDYSTWGQANAAHILIATGHGLQHLKTARVPVEKHSRVTSTNASTEICSSFEEPFSTLLEPLQQWRLAEKIKDVATFQSSNGGFNIGGDPFSSTHLASVLTEEGHIYQWDPQGGLLVPSSATFNRAAASVSPLENLRRYASLEYSDHCQTVYLAVGEAVYACDHRCSSPSGGARHAKLYALQQSGSINNSSSGGSNSRSGDCIYSLKKSPMGGTTTATATAFSAAAPTGQPHQFYLSTSAAEVLLVDLRFPRGYVDHQLVSNGQEVYKHLKVYAAADRNDRNRTSNGSTGGGSRYSGSAVLLVGSESFKDQTGHTPSSGAINIHRIETSSGNTCNNDGGSYHGGGGGGGVTGTALMSSFLSAARHYGLENRVGFTAQWHTRSFRVAGTEGFGMHYLGPLYSHRGRSKAGGDSGLSGLSDTEHAAGTHNYLSGLELVDVSAEQAELHRLHQETREEMYPDVRKEKKGTRGRGVFGRYLVCHQLNGSGDVHVEATDLGNDNDNGGDLSTEMGSGVVRSHFSGYGNSNNSVSSCISTRSTSHIGSTGAMTAEPVKRQRRSENSISAPELPGLYLTSGLTRDEDGSAVLAPSGATIPTLSYPLLSSLHLHNTINGSGESSDEFISLSLQALQNDHPSASAQSGARRSVVNSGAAGDAGTTPSAGGGTGIRRRGLIVRKPRRVVRGEPCLERTHTEARHHQLQELAAVFLNRYHTNSADADSGTYDQRFQLQRSRRWWRVLCAKGRRDYWDDDGNVTHASYHTTTSSSNKSDSSSSSGRRVIVISTATQLHKYVWSGRVSSVQSDASSHASADANANTNVSSGNSNDFGSGSSSFVMGLAPDLYNPLAPAPVPRPTDTAMGWRDEHDEQGDSNSDSDFNAVYEFIAHANDIDLSGGAAIAKISGSAIESGKRVTLWEITKYLNSYVLPFVLLTDSETDIGAPLGRLVVSPVVVRQYIYSELFASTCKAISGDKDLEDADSDSADADTDTGIVESMSSYSSDNYSILGDGLAVVRNQWSEIPGQATPCTCALQLGKNRRQHGQSHRSSSYVVNMCNVEWGQLNVCPVPHLICYSLSSTSVVSGADVISPAIASSEAAITIMNTYANSGSGSGSGGGPLSIPSFPTSGASPYTSSHVNSAYPYTYKSTPAPTPVPVPRSVLSPAVRSDVTAEMVKSLRNVW